MDSLAVNSYSSTETNKPDKDLSYSSVDNEFHMRLNNEDIDVIPRGDDTYTVMVRNIPFTLKGTGQSALANLLKEIKTKIGDVNIETAAIQRQILAVKAETSRLKVQSAEKAKDNVANNNKKGK